MTFLASLDFTFWVTRLKSHILLSRSLQNVYCLGLYLLLPTECCKWVEGFRSQTDLKETGQKASVALANPAFPPRWKGENVATTEVADIVGLVDFVEEVNVYGVPVPGM